MKALPKLFFAIAFLLLLALSTGNRIPEATLLGDPISGGRIYDNWMTALDLKPPQSNQPLWAEQSTNPRNGEVTWRCKECHGWDYKGADGAFGLASFRYTGFPGLSGAIGESQDEVLAWLNGTNNPDHNFADLTNPNAMNDVAAFLRTMQIDAALVIDYQTGLALGDEDNGLSLYLNNCVECHGNSGRAINFSADGQPLYVGDIASEDPWRALHKLRFGTVTGNMPSAEREGWSLRDIADVLSYAQSLPRGNLNYAIARNISDDLAIDRQGEIEPIIWAAAIMVSVISAGFIWDLLRNRRKSS